MEYIDFEYNADYLNADPSSVNFQVMQEFDSLFQQNAAKPAPLSLTIPDMLNTPSPLLSASPLSAQECMDLFGFPVASPLSPPVPTSPTCKNNSIPVDGNFPCTIPGCTKVFAKNYNLNRFDLNSNVTVI